MYLWFPYTQTSRHKARKHKLRRRRFGAITSSMFNYRCYLPVEQGKKDENLSELAKWVIRELE